MEIVYHLGVSFCVTQNAFNFIDIKKQEHSCTVQLVFYSTTWFFFKLGELLLLFASHKQFTHCNGSIVIFDGCWIKIIFTIISSYIKDLNLGKIPARQYFIFKLMFVIGYNNQFKVVRRKLFCKLFVKDN